ncbi:hypothetical protein ACOSQ2_015654 [Xanthoceras sorbifolium]
MIRGQEFRSQQQAQILRASCSVSTDEMVIGNAVDFSANEICLADFIPVFFLNILAFLVFSCFIFSIIVMKVTAWTESCLFFIENHCDYLLLSKIVNVLTKQHWPLGTKGMAWNDGSTSSNCRYN